MVVEQGVAGWDCWGWGFGWRKDGICVGGR